MNSQQIVTPTNMAMSSSSQKNMINDNGELWLFGEIGDWWDGLDAESVLRQVYSASTNKIKVRIHSPGGSIQEGLAMYNSLKNIDKEVDFYIEGIAFSMASVIAMAGTVHMPPSAMMMIHKPSVEIQGDATYLRDNADTLDDLEDILINIYHEKTGINEDELAKMLAAETWMNGQVAYEKGFVDHLIADEVRPVANTSDFSIPQNLKNHYLNSVKIERQSERSDMSTTQNDDDPKSKKTSDRKKESGSIRNLDDSGGSDMVHESEAPAFSAAVDAAAIAADERKRITNIQRAGAQLGIDSNKVNDFIASGNSFEACSHEMLSIAEARQVDDMPSGHVRTVNGRSMPLSNSMAHALSVRCNPGTEAHTSESGEFRGMSLVEMAREMIAHSGENVRGWSKQKIAYTAMHSTSDFPLILEDLGRKQLLSAYKRKPATFKRFARRTSFGDFKAKNVYRIGEGSDLEKVNERGEYKQGTVSESKESYAPETYGRIFTFSRKLLINDDLDALNRFMSRQGAKAATLESKLVWELILSNPSMGDKKRLFLDALFTNGTPSAITSAALDEMWLHYAKQKDLDGEPVDIMPKYLFVPPSRRTEAMKLMAAINETKTDDVNIHSDSLEVVVENRLEVGNKPWFGFCESDEADHVEYGYLEGEEDPYLETSQDFKTDGLSLKVRHDFAAGIVGRVGTYRNEGVSS